MTKIVINRCFGGFGLSYKAVMRYAELSGFELYPVVNPPGGKFGIDFEHYVPFTANSDDFFITYSKEPLQEDSTLVKGSYFSIYDIERTDPYLVHIVEDMGEGANGQCANLVVVEIPDDVSWAIDDYDGIETIHEGHRLWP